MSKRNREENNEPFGDLMKSMNHFFQERPVKGFLQSIDEFFKNPFPYSPAFQVDLKETVSEYMITAELPGINREQIQLDVLENYITISIHSNELFTEEDEKGSIIKRRQSMQKSTRTIPLPQLINERSVKASYKNGLLKIRIPKQKGKQILIEPIE